ncbi:cytochrome C oxidase subunit IV family protein [Methylobacterium dankookense]|jgi:hypothetical protein|uniref:Cytochrome C oxidase subunit IV n=1 Tax=Methylobacterium dankookense TaxID=560405 RepID=A0A564G2F3_9HYPH|nr:cytochrome C oxidase subunit IV family protein [Methylobacterium dankookense]GJD57697.1 hypothetical protein IFDJLNFL_3609 [Methylobacterium dankookense]VUF13791.1 hypothetical protein MTDSW087_03498 [Methylobacterium dankookense]
MTGPPARAWLVLLALTGMAMWTGGPNGSSPLGVLGIAALVAVSGFKAVLILRDFLELGRARASWRIALYGYVAVLGGAIFVAYAAVAG